MDFPQDEFDDPALRSAIRRAVGKPSAPPRLRENVAALLASGRSAPLTRSPRSRWSIPRITPKLAALAACVVIALSFAGYELYDFVAEMYPRAAISAPALSTAMSSAMMASHDALAKEAQHQPVSSVDFASIRTKLTKEAGFAAFAAPLGDGWELKDARLTKIDGKSSTQALYVRKDEAASVFSIPVMESSCSSGTHICQAINGHPFAALTHGNVMYAVEVTSSNDAARAPPGSDAESILATVTQIVSTPSTAPAATQR